MRILFVARPIAVHSARWINQVADQGWDLHLFPAFEAPLHPDFRNITVYGLKRYPVAKGVGIRQRALWPLPAGGDRAQTLARRLPPRWGARAAWLARVIDWLKPDIIHSLEFQLAGYLTLEARSFFLGRFPPWFISCWGSDIYLYGPLAAHREKVKGVLAHCDYYTSDCHRDVLLAREYGFQGETLAVLPVGGGFHVEKLRQYCQPGPTSARRVIALKGYQHSRGRALAALQAIEQCADVLTAGGYRIAVYLADEAVELAAERLMLATGLPVDIIPPSSHEDILRLHGRSRVSIGLSISDGLSTAALEAMVMGAFPIQSDTGCFEEVVRNGQTALIVPAEDPDATAAAIRRAVTDDEMVDRAAETNTLLAARHFDYAVVQPQVVAMYERIATQGHAKKESKL